MWKEPKKGGEGRRGSDRYREVGTDEFGEAGAKLAGVL